MHYLYRVNTLQRDTGDKKFVVLTELVILQPQRLVKSLEIIFLKLFFRWFFRLYHATRDFFTCTFR